MYYAKYIFGLGLLIIDLFSIGQNTLEISEVNEAKLGTDVTLKANGLKLNQKSFNAYPQSFGVGVTMSSGRWKKAKKAIENNTPPSIIKKKYKRSNWSEDVLLYSIAMDSFFYFNSDYPNKDTALIWVDDYWKLSPSPIFTQQRVISSSSDSFWILNLHNPWFLTDAYQSGLMFTQWAAYFSYTPFFEKEIPKEYANYIRYAHLLFDSTFILNSYGFNSESTDTGINILFDSLIAESSWAKCMYDQRPSNNVLRVKQLAAQLGNSSAYLQSIIWLTNNLNPEIDTLCLSSQEAFSSLQSIGIKVEELIIGSCFISQEFRAPRYISLTKLGAILSATEQKEKWSQVILHAINDENLDWINRCQLAKLFYYWAESEMNDATMEEMIKQLRLSMEYWPFCLTNPFKKAVYKVCGNQ